MRQDHAILDAKSRRYKAQKVISILKRRIVLDKRSILEIGTGSGILASTISGEVGPDGSVWALDVKDQRVHKCGYKFKIIDSVSLPFSDGLFDIVVSNHVIEHVGSQGDQTRHLSEIFRVLKPGGYLYLAVPNRWRLVEPHYRIPFLSWMPKWCSDKVVQATRRNDEYDCELLSRGQLREFLKSTEFTWDEVDYEAIELMAEIEKHDLLIKMVNSIPRTFVSVFFIIIPTLIVVARKPDVAYSSNESFASQP
jgi:SAM-dependent methyltransferase